MYFSAMCKLARCGARCCWEGCSARGDSSRVYFFLVVPVSLVGFFNHEMFKKRLFLNIHSDVFFWTCSVPY
jgi:hypothetical protein